MNCAPNLALFDFDGTITHTDTFRGFIHYCASRRRMAAGSALLAVPLLGYRLGWLPGTHLRTWVSRLAFAGRKHQEVEQSGLQFAREVIPGLLRPNALERLAWHREQGDRIVVVSASLDVYLRPWCEQNGYDLLCTQLDVRGSRLTGAYLGGDCAGPEKAHRVRQSFDLTRFRTVYAYGDTAEDDALLQLAHERYMCWQRLPNNAV